MQLLQRLSILTPFLVPLFAGIFANALAASPVFLQYGGMDGMMYFMMFGGIIAPAIVLSNYLFPGHSVDKFWQALYLIVAAMSAASGAMVGFIMARFPYAFTSLEIGLVPYFAILATLAFTIVQLGILVSAVASQRSPHLCTRYAL